MSKVAKILGTISSIASTVFAFAGNPVLAGAFAANAALMNGIAAATAKKPAAQGQMDKRMFGANSPSIYAIGRSYSAGAQVHDAAWGGKVSKVMNPYRFLVVVLSCAGPIHAIDSVWFDHAQVPFSGSAATGYYAGFVYKDQQLGAQPENDALVSAPGQGWGVPPGWGSDYKLSGKAAVALSFKFDKDGKKFAQGMPPIGFIRRGVRTYDARQDSSFPGGSGAHRLNDESTWAYSEDPAQHAVAYAYGRRENGKLVFGPGLEATSIDLAVAVAWSNVCDANGWKVGGDIYEPGDPWNNLKRICQAGGAEPVIGSDGVLTFKYQAPRVSLGTIGRADIKGETAESANARTFRERVNTIVPRFRSEANQWNYVQATAQSVAAFLAADGGVEKTEEIQYDLVQIGNQSAELAQYEIWQRREPLIAPVTVGPEYMHYQTGDTLTLLADTGLWHESEDLDVVVQKKTIDPLTGLVTFEFEGENPAKHPAVLGATAAAPPAVTIPTAEERDIAFGFNIDHSAARRFVVMVPPLPATSDDDSISIAAFDGTLDDGRQMSFPADTTTLVSLPSGTKFALFRDLASATYVAAAEPATAEFADPDKAFLYWIATSTAGSYPSADPPPGGYGGGGGFYQNNFEF